MKYIDVAFSIMNNWLKCQCDTYIYRWKGYVQEHDGGILMGITEIVHVNHHCTKSPMSSYIECRWSHHPNSLD